MATLKYIEVENFKSFRGSTSIGPLNQFTAVIGPNGSGKSNFMDAISFAMGEDVSNLRVRRLNDLIHGAAIEDPISNRAKVTAVFSNSNGERTQFTREIVNSTSRYSFNNQVVSHGQYVNELKVLGINVKAKNFLVFQGTINSIAMKRPKELTALFEEISGSGEKKVEYTRLKEAMNKAEITTQMLYERKNGIAADKKEAKIEKIEAEKFEKLKNEFAEKRLQFYLFQLYHCETAKEDYLKAAEQKRTEIVQAIRSKETVEDELKNMKKILGQSKREVAAAEQMLRESKIKVNRIKPKLSEAKVQEVHNQTNLDRAITFYRKAEAAEEAHKKDISSLQTDLRELEELQAHEAAEEHQNMQLDDEKLEEYHQLKEQVERLTACELQDFRSTEHVQKDDEQKHDNEGRKETETKDKISQKQKKSLTERKRFEKLTEIVERDEYLLDHQMQNEQQLTKDINAANATLNEVNESLEKLEVEWRDGKFQNSENKRRTQLNEIVVNLKQQFPGVIGRILELCDPTHPRYRIAVTKVLGKNMNSIIVDTMKTAKLCVKYLKENYLPAQTFLPLDHIVAPPLNERLRLIDGEVRLLFDVIRFEPAKIKPAILFVTKNVLVCEKAERAQEVAYNYDDRSHSVVAYDGTYYQASGFISGGAQDLERRASQWDKEALTTRRNELIQRKREALKVTKKNSELTTLKSNIKGSEAKLKWARHDMENTKKNLKNLEEEIEILTNELSEIRRRKTELENQMSERRREIDNRYRMVNAHRDQVFAQFCKEIGVADITVYEDFLNRQKQREQRRLELQGQRERLQGQLDFEMNKKNLRENVEKWKTDSENHEKELQTCKDKTKSIESELDKEMQTASNLKDSLLTTNKKQDRAKKDVKETQTRFSAAQRKIRQLQVELAALERNIHEKQYERHILFRKCQVDDIPIPLNQGSLSDIQDIPSQDNGESDEGTPHSGSSLLVYRREENIVVDYSSLSDDLINTAHVEAKIKDMANEVELASNRLLPVEAPNMKATQKFADLSTKLAVATKEFERARRAAQKATEDFEKIKKERFDKFMDCFDSVSKSVEEIYKVLTKNNSAQAVLMASNPEEPYLDGLRYSCVAPGKRFQLMNSLSGGEKTLAALALLFALHNCQPAPFFVLDEIDAALDNTNIAKVADYIKSQKAKFQNIVISLKEEFYSHAEVLVGITTDEGNVTVSRALLLDLTEYPEGNEPALQENRRRPRQPPDPSSSEQSPAY